MFFLKFFSKMCVSPFLLQDFVSTVIHLLDSPSTAIRAKAFLVLLCVLSHNREMLLLSCQARWGCLCLLLHHLRCDEWCLRCFPPASSGERFLVSLCLVQEFLPTPKFPVGVNLHLHSQLGSTGDPKSAVMWRHGDQCLVCPSWEDNPRHGVGVRAGL